MTTEDPYVASDAPKGAALFRPLRVNESPFMAFLGKLDTLAECSVCGAAVSDEERHADWHSTTTGVPDA